MKCVYELDTKDASKKAPLIERIKSDPTYNKDLPEGVQPENLESRGIVDLAKKLLELDPYGKISFSRNGYKLKDGTVLSEREGNLYLYISAGDEFFSAFADKKLSGIFSRCAADVEERIIKKIDDEENNATAGFGAIFG